MTVTPAFKLADLMALGGQISGPLLLDGLPVSPTEAADKAYVDAHSGSGGIADAPNDAYSYVRHALAWQNFGALNGLLTLPRSAFPAFAVTATGATALNLANGEVQTINLTGNATLTASGWPASGTWAKLVLQISNTGAFNITSWPTGVIWPGGTAPTITSGAGKRDCVILMSADGGVTVWGSVVGQDYR
jgi:hypothetical protein